MSNNKGINNNESNKPSELIGLFNLYYNTNDENYWEIINNTDNKFFKEIVFFDSYKANDDISISFSGRTSFIVFLKDQKQDNTIQQTILESFKQSSVKKYKKI
ncbi:890_t:CDS:2 [Cetraspora pellucida]|uniref:890_t:CDS:1 n=1 Tax=Cetraspora pellucida TaxID=1433469 RepID=A0A9N9CG11_9GLOM|nr:890_t:CDS:2 [Cetraspora pellucida]